METATEAETDCTYEFARDRGPTPWAFEYTLRKAESPRPDGRPIYEVTTPYRQIIWAGDTPEEAIGTAMRGLAELAREGKLDPECPARRGVPPIQHAMRILADQLAWHIDRRREQIEFVNEKADERPDSNDIEMPNSPRLNRLNEIISGLATSVAALARVKEL